MSSTPIELDEISINPTTNPPRANPLSSIENNTKIVNRYKKLFNNPYKVLKTLLNNGLYDSDLELAKKYFKDNNNQFYREACALIYPNERCDRHVILFGLIELFVCLDFMYNNFDNFVFRKNILHGQKYLSEILNNGEYNELKRALNVFIKLKNENKIPDYSYLYVNGNKPMPYEKIERFPVFTDATPTQRRTNIFNPSRFFQRLTRRRRYNEIPTATQIAGKKHRKTRRSRSW